MTSIAPLRCVLIADDEVLLAEIASEWLLKKGFRVLVAGNGRAAWEIVQHTRVDVVISDVRMPVMGGFALLQRISAFDGHRPRVIFATAFSDFDSRNAYDLGLDAILVKPIRRQTLEDAVERAIAGHARDWATPPPPATGVPLHNSFPSLRDALRAGAIALGRGGFCLSSSFRLPGVLVPFDLRFSADTQRIAGQGVISWSTREQQQVGVEITYLESDCRDWVTRLLSKVAAPCLIPREAAPLI
jgi:CheY-like chemotaxis protein